jgi:hypothetical protein
LALLRLFDAATFLAGTVLAGLLAAPRARTATPTLEPFRFRFKGLATMLFIFARTVLRATRPPDPDLLLPTRFRTLDEDASLEVRFDAGFARAAGPVFFVFDFVVFFDLRAAIATLSTRERLRTPSTRAQTPLFKKQLADFLSTKSGRLGPEPG